VSILSRSRWSTRKEQGTYRGRTATRLIVCSSRRHKPKTYRWSATSDCLTRTVSEGSGRSRQRDRGRMRTSTATTPQFRSVLHNLGKTRGIEAGAPHQRAVNLTFRHQGRSIAPSSIAKQQQAREVSTTRCEGVLARWQCLSRVPAKRHSVGPASVRQRIAVAVRKR